MKLRAIIRIIGLLIIIFSWLLLIPGIIALIYRDGAGVAFVKGFVAALVLGIVLWFPHRGQKTEFKTREGFLIVVLIWAVLGTVSAFPFLYDDHVNLSITDAFFESFSSLTTTGASVLPTFDGLPKALLFYRQLLQWIGGIGIIVLAIAILPLLGIGGMQAYRAEIPGPEKNKKMRPRVAQTANMLWSIYLLLTVACAVCLWLAGMPFFDAICNGFGVLSLSGSSVHDGNIGHYNSTIINLVIAFFMLVAACNFNLHFAAVNGMNLRTYWRDPEFRFFIKIFTGLFSITAVSLWMTHDYSIAQSADSAFFHSSSMLATAGFSTESISDWPLYLVCLLYLSTFIGGCVGSTGGGLKVMRVLLLYLQGSRELKRLVHPNAIYSIKLGERVLPERVVEAVWGFFSAYALIFLLSFLAITATGLDTYTAFSVVTAGLNNLGSGLGSVSDNFSSMSDAAKWIMVLDMLFGRLEIFTLLVIFTPTFWRN